MALIVAAANGWGISYILFPELAALTGDVLARPSGKWAKEPWKLIATPSIAATIGVQLSAHLPYGVVPILLSLLSSLLLIRLLKSSVSPAISAGILPIVLGIHSWLYPLCILVTISALALLLIVWRKTPWGSKLLIPISAGDRVIEALESPPRENFWLPSLTLFVLLAGLAAQISHWRFILFPPLVVMAYEMLGHPETCPWAKRPFLFPVICSLSALLGVETVRLLGTNPLAAAIVVAGAILMLQVGRLRLPPALAIGLIPFILPSPKIEYAVSVAIGTSSLCAWFTVGKMITDPIAVRSKLPPSPSL